MCKLTLCFYVLLYGEGPLYISTDGVCESLQLAGALSYTAAAAALRVVVKVAVVVGAAVVNLAADVIFVNRLILSVERDGTACAPVVECWAVVPAKFQS